MRFHEDWGQAEVSLFSDVSSSYHKYINVHFEFFETSSLKIATVTATIDYWISKIKPLQNLSIFSFPK